MRIWRYKVKYYQSIDNIESVESGLLVAEEWVNAAIKLQDYYGEDLRKILYLEYMTDNESCFPINEQQDIMLDNLQKAFDEVWQ